MCGLRLVALRKWTYKHKIHQTYYQISKYIYPFYSSLLRRDVYVPTAFLPPSLASFVHLAEAQGVCHAYSAAHPISCKILLQVSMAVSTMLGRNCSCTAAGKKIICNMTVKEQMQPNLATEWMGHTVYRRYT